MSNDQRIARGRLSIEGDDELAGRGEYVIGCSQEKLLAAASGQALEALDKVSAPDLVYPHWRQRNTAADRLGAADLALLGQHLPGS